MYSVDSLEYAVRHLFQGGIGEHGYSEEEVETLLHGIDFEALLQAVRHNAQTVHAYTTDGKAPMSFNYRGRDLFGQRATRLYAVLGHLDQFFPEITVRMSCGGTYCELDPGLIFEGLGEVFPREWRDNVKTGETRAIKDAKARLREVLLSGTFLEGEL